MNYLFGLIILSVFLLTGCKDGEVSFNSAQSSERIGEEPFAPIDPNPGGPNGPIEPKPEDPIGPTVKIVKSPADHRLNETTNVVFEVIEGDFEIAEVRCLVNQLEIPCDRRNGLVELSGYPLGRHLFEVVATDRRGLTGQARDRWSIMNRFKRITDSFEVKEGANKTDILFVVDNSGSMRNEQSKISDRFDKFIEQVSGLDWHLGITTTDPRNSEVWNDGKLHPFDNGQAFLTPAVGQQQAQRMFAKQVMREEVGWDTERGIYATYRSIERAFSDQRYKFNRDLASFFRPEAALAIVVVSDENESVLSFRSEGANLLELIDRKMGHDKVFQFNSIIVHTQECLQGEGASMGYEYEWLSSRTNGIVGDICAENYSEILKDIGKGVSDLQKSYKLQCAPLDTDGDGKLDLVVETKSSNPIPGYVIEKDNVVFDIPLIAGAYNFKYFCLD